MVIEESNLLPSRRYDTPYFSTLDKLSVRGFIKKGGRTKINLNWKKLTFIFDAVYKIKGEKKKVRSEDYF